MNEDEEGEEGRKKVKRRERGRERLFFLSAFLLSLSLSVCVI